MSTNKLTGAMLKQMIEKVLEDYSLLTPLPLAAEPPADDPTQEPPAEDNESSILEQTIHSYKGNKKPVNHAAEALKHLKQCTDEQLAFVYKQQGVQTYEQWLQAVARYERAKKPK